MDSFEERLSDGLRDIADRAYQAPDPNLAQPRLMAARWARVPLTAAAAVAVIAAGIIGVVVAMDSRPDQPDSAIVEAANDPTSNRSVAPTTDPALANRSAVDEFEMDMTADRLAAYSDRDGFGKIRVDYESGTVSVFWKGPTPREVADMAGIGDNGVRVVLMTAKYSAEEVGVAARSVMRAYADFVTGATANSDMTGLVVDVLDSWEGTAAELEDAAGMPVEVRTDDNTTFPPPTSRPVPLARPSQATPAPR